ncbi:MAG: hypothetical protein WBN08_17155, partial [Thiogranum sp.]
EGVAKGCNPFSLRDKVNRRQGRGDFYNTLLEGVGERQYNRMPIRYNTVWGALLQTSPRE